MTESAPLVQNTDLMELQPFQNAAGHGGVMQDLDGGIVVKPCTQAEIDFYQETLSIQPGFAAFMPTFMGTLALGDHSGTIVSNAQDVDAANRVENTKKLKTETAIVLENVESGYRHPNVIDLKLGAKLYAPGTADEKAARLDKVASETTSGSLNFRIAGMKVWNTEKAEYDIYDKQYGRHFDAANVSEGFATFFKTLTRSRTAKHVLEDILAGLVGLISLLEAAESRFYSSSILLVYEGDPQTLETLSSPHLLATVGGTGTPTNTDGPGQDDELSSESDTDDEPLPPFKLKVIDFAHSKWCPGEGADENVIKGVRSIENQISQLVADRKPA